MKRKLGRKLLSFLLTLAMAVGLFPGMGVTVLAEETGASETLNLSEIRSEGYGDDGAYLPTENTVTFSGYNAKAEGHAWDKDGWLIGLVDSTSYNGLTFRALRGKIIKVVLQSKDAGQNDLNKISVDDTYGSITTDGSKKIYKASAGQGVESVIFTYAPDSGERTDFVQFSSATVYYATATSYTVTVTPGSNVTRTEEFGAETQTNLSGPMAPVTYRANDGYIFPIDGNFYKTIFGIAVQRISDTEVRVLGTPIVDTCVTVPNAVPTTDTIGSFSLNLNDVPVPVNGLQELIATVGPYNVKDKRVKWSVSGDAVKLYTDSTCATEVGEAATDLRTVYAKGISEGKATVTVTSNLNSQKSARCEVTVEKEVSEWAVGDSINLYGKYFLYDDDGKIAENLKQSRNIPHPVPTPDILREQWRFPGTIYVAGDNKLEGLFFDLPKDRSWDEIPSGFKVKSGSGSQSDPYQFELVYKHNVTVKPASNMTKTSNSGAAEQKGLTGKMEDVVYLADDGYYFPENYSVGEYDEDYDEEDGIIVTRDSSAQITVSGKPLTHITINLPPPTAKGQAAVAQAPAARTLTYTGSAQALVSGGTPSGGTMQYAVGTDDATAPDATAFADKIPEKTEAGTYYVWYKAKGDASHSDSKPGVVSVTIKEKTDPHEHDIKKMDAKEPTCTENGYKAHYECTECDKWFEDANGSVEITDKPSFIIDATGHKWDDGVVTKEATYDETGIRTFTCENDPSHTKEETIPRLSSSSSSDSDSDSDSGDSGSSSSSNDSDSSSSDSGSSGGSGSKNNSVSKQVMGVDRNVKSNVPSNHQVETGLPASDVGGKWIYNSDSDTWSYMKSDGTLAKKEWLSLDYNGLRYWYYFNDKGIMLTNWFDYNGERFYLMPKKDGWLGRMATGWKNIDNKWYYFDIVPGSSQGRLCRSSVTPDGHAVGADGAWDGSGATPVGQE